MAPAKIAFKINKKGASTEQLHEMIDFFQEHPGLAQGNIQRKVDDDQKWEEMTLRLNAIGVVQKSSEQWRTLWRDLKTRTRDKVRYHQRQRARAVNRSIDQAPLTELEQRIVSIIAPNCTEDNDENELENQRETNEDGTEAILLQIVQSQADTMRTFAECSTKQVEAQAAMVDAINTLREGTKALTDAINNLARVLELRRQRTLITSPTE